MEGAQIFGGVLGLIIGIFLFALAILWFLLPFAVFGVKDRLDKVIAELRHQNKLLIEITQSKRQ